jgi:hypothetical protein
MWEVENISDEDLVYYRVHKIYYNKGKLQSGVFKEQGNAMSVDWCKYSTPDDSISRAKIPEDNGIVSFVVGDLRSLYLDVKHSPSKNNRAHSDVKGRKKLIKSDSEIRFKLKRMAKWEIPLNRSK